MYSNTSFKVLVYILEGASPHGWMYSSKALNTRVVLKVLVRILQSKLRSSLCYYCYSAAALVNLLNLYSAVEYNTVLSSLPIYCLLKG